MRSRSTCPPFFVVILCVLFLDVPQALGQFLTGQIDGTVMDEQGNVIPGVEVTAVHVGTNSRYQALSSDLGRFIFPNVRLGPVTVEASMSGFRTAIVTKVQVEVGQTSSLQITLQVGAPTDEITVTSEFAQSTVNNIDAEISNIVDNRRVLELPLDGRNASQLITLQAGVFYETTSTGEGNKLIIHGQRHGSLAITLDGVDTQDNMNRASSIMINQPLLALTAENVQEFKVVTGMSSAEYSRGASQMTAVTRAGTNDWHGSVFYFHRNTVLNANNFFNNSSDPHVERPPLLRHQFGGRIGGPIIKDKTFFYFGYQQTRESRGIPVNRTVYTQQARNGQFRYLDNLLTTPENVAANPDLIRSANIMECSANIQGILGKHCVDERFDQSNPATLDPFITGTMFGDIPLPNNFDFGDGLNTGGFRFNAQSSTVEHLPSFRLDHIFNDRHSFYGSLNYVDRQIDGDFVNEREPRFPDLPPLGSRVTHSKGFSTTLTSTLRPTLLNEFRVGRLVHGENAFIINQPYPTEYTLDLNTVTDPYSPGNGDDVRDSDTYHIRDTINWVKGNHQFKFGGEWRHRWVHTYSFDETMPYGDIDLDDNDFPADFSEGDLRTISGGTDIESADYERARDLMNNLVGALSEVEARYNVTTLTSGFVANAPERRKYQNREFDVFFNDTWRLRPNFTLNLGLRWEWSGVPYETQGLALIPPGGGNAAFGVSGRGGFFNPGTFDGHSCSELSALPVERTTDNAVALIEGCTVQFVPGTSSNGIPLWKDDYNNFAPVIGFAWDPFGTGKTSIRAGFRISYIGGHFNIIDGNLDDNEGLRVDEDCVPSDGECQFNPLYLRDIQAGQPPVAAVPEFMLPSSRSILNSSTNDFRTYMDDLSSPYYAEWTFGIQREIFRNTGLEVRYVGNHGVKLRRVADFNEFNLNAVDPVSGMTFLDSFLIAQSNLSCNRSTGRGDRYDDRTGEACITPNPLMAALIATDANRLDSRNALISALDFNQTGHFLHRLTQVETSRPASGEGRIRGGAVWGAILEGRIPLNFFQANPFVASSRAMVNDGFSKYHGLEIELNRRFAQGLALQVNYTWQKALADFDGDTNTLVNDVRPSSVINPGYTIQQFMPQHQFNSNWIYELPFGRGRRYSSSSSALDQIAGGWQFGGIISVRSGRPVSFESNVGTFHREAISDENTVSLSQEVTRSQLQAMTGRRDIAGGVFWFDPCLSAQIGSECSSSGSIQGLLDIPRSGQLGELGQTPVFGPSRFVFDFNLSKRTAINDEVELEFRWEVFNAFNNVNFGLPSSDIRGTSFGQVTNTVTGSRVMQFAMKFNF